MKPQLSVKRVLVDGTLMSVLLTIITFGSIYVNPMMLVDSYTPDVQAAVGEVEVPALQLIVFYARACAGKTAATYPSGPLLSTVLCSCSSLQSGTC